MRSLQRRSGDESIHDRRRKRCFRRRRPYRDDGAKTSKFCAWAKGVKSCKPIGPACAWLWCVGPRNKSATCPRCLTFRATIPSRKSRCPTALWHLLNFIVIKALTGVRSCLLIMHRLALAERATGGSGDSAPAALIVVTRSQDRGFGPLRNPARTSYDGAILLGLRERAERVASSRPCVDGGDGGALRSDDCALQQSATTGRFRRSARPSVAALCAVRGRRGFMLISDI